MRKKTIKVRAGRLPDGTPMTLPLPSGQAIDSVVTVLTPETTVEVILDRYTRGRLACGDMVEVKDEVKDEPSAPPLPPGARRGGKE